MKASEDHPIPASVDLFLPDDYTRILQELVDAGKAYAAIEIIHGALWIMRGSEMTPAARKAEINAEIQAGLDHGSISKSPQSSGRSFSDAAGHGSRGSRPSVSSKKSAIPYCLKSSMRTYTAVIRMGVCVSPCHARAVGTHCA